MLEIVFYSTVLYHVDDANSVNDQSLFVYSVMRHKTAATPNWSRLRGE